LPEKSRFLDWPDSVGAFVVDQCLDRHAMADLATKISLTSKPEGMNILMRLSESKSWSDLLDLAKFNYILADHKRLPVGSAILKDLKSELQWFIEKINSLEEASDGDLVVESDDELVTHFSATHCAIDLIDGGASDQALTETVYDFFDVRQRLIDSLLEVSEMSDARLKAKLMVLSHAPGSVHPCERHWKRFARGPKPRVALWKQKMNVKLCEKLAEQFFDQKVIPKVIQQRLNLARYLFNQHFWTEEGLGEKYSTIYEQAFEKALKLQSACTLDLLRTQDQAKAKKIHYQLKWIQSLLPPQSIVDFASAYFEYRFLPPVSQNEERILALTQADQQLPNLVLACSTSASHRPKLMPYLQGLVKKLLRVKVWLILRMKEPVVV
jgi:hypothetical protein